MTPLAVLRQELAAAKRAGADFGDGWPAAVDAALASETGTEHAHWQAALRSTRNAWLAAYQGQPSALAPLPLPEVELDAPDDSEAARHRSRQARRTVLV